MTDDPDKLVDTHLEIALEVGDLGVWQWDLATGLIRWSEHLERIHGFQPGAFDGSFEAFASTIHPEDREQVLANVTAAVEGSTDLRNEYRFVGKAGAKGWIQGNGRVLRDADGTPKTVIGVAKNVTDLVEARELFRHQRDELAQLMEERSRLTRLLQRTLLPEELPAPPGTVVCSAYRAAGAEATGDFYDLAPRGHDNDWLLVVGDICGHGPEAAVLTGSLRRAIQAAGSISSSPAEILHTANQVYCRTTEENRFATAQVVLLRPSPGGAFDVIVGTAGHPPLLVVRRDGSTEWVSGSGVPLGLIPGTEYVASKTEISSGDLLVGYTDGLTEARRADGSFFGEAGLMDAVVRAVDEGYRDQVADRVLRELTAESPATDDAACVSIRVE